MLTSLTALALSASLCGAPPAPAPAAGPATLAAAGPAGTAASAVHEADSLRQIYETGLTWEAFFAQADDRRELWIEHSDNATPHGELVERAEAAGGSWRILAIAVPGCSDSVGTLPYLASLADAVPTLELRIADSEVGRPWMEAFRTPDGRAATPTILLLDEDFELRGCWVEMPASVWEFWQPALERGEAAEMLDQKMAWYLEDRGREALTGLMEILEAAQRGEMVCPAP